MSLKCPHYSYDHDIILLHWMRPTITPKPLTVIRFTTTQQTCRSDLKQTVILASLSQVPNELFDRRIDVDSIFLTASALCILKEVVSLTVLSHHVINRLFEDVVVHVFVFLLLLWLSLCLPLTKVTVEWCSSGKCTYMRWLARLVICDELSRLNQDTQHYVIKCCFAIIFHQTSAVLQYGSDSLPHRGIECGYRTVLYRFPYATIEQNRLIVIDQITCIMFCLSFDKTNLNPDRFKFV